ncbi:MAG: tyrosine-type recombinase/integrase [Pelosinus sp.]|nr:tyrosine-type recombinase/integrase [Pelosinus sp.]
MKTVEKVSQQLYDFMDYLQVERNASLHTVNSYRADIECFISFARLQGAVGEVLFSRVDNILIRAYIASLANDGYAARTILRRVSALKTFFRFFSKVYGIENYPFTDVHIKADKKGLPACLSAHEITELLQMPGHDYLGIRDSAILELLYATGLRVGELVGLTVKDVDLEAKYILIYGNKARVVPIGRYALAAVAHYLAFSRSKLCKSGSTESLFVNAQGGALSDRSVRRIVSKYAQKFGKKLSPHTFRYTVALHLLAGGANIEVVQEMLGQLNFPRNQFEADLPGERLKSVYKGAHPRA